MATWIWISNRGEMSCGERGHGGNYFTSHLRAHPDAVVFTTPLDVWERVEVSAADLREWQAVIGNVAMCGGCRHDQEKAAPPLP